jgi:uncharacterized protein GlcG (DUF336 family)
MGSTTSPITIGLTAALVLGAVDSAFATPVTTKYQDGHVWGLHALPGDVLPPFGIPDANNKLPPYPNVNGGNMHPYTTSNPESKAPGPPLDVALGGVQAALNECESRNELGSAVVIDTAGAIRAALAVDGTDGTHLFVAARKALTALTFDEPSVDVMNAAKRGDPYTLARINSAMFVQFGAFPLHSKGKLIGAIGYSGGKDLVCAKAGADYIEAHLPK